MGFVSRFPLAKLIHGNGHQPGLRITFDNILTKSCAGIAAQLASTLAQRLERSIDSLNHSAGSNYVFGKLPGTSGKWILGPWGRSCSHINEQGFPDPLRDHTRTV